MCPLARRVGPTDRKVCLLVTPFRRKLIWWIAGAVVLIALLAVAIPFIFIHFIEGPPPAKLGLPTTHASTSAPGATSTAVSSSAVNGTWNVGSGSEAGYRVQEVLVGQSTTAVGRTSRIWGSLTIAGSTVTKGSFTVDMASVVSDQSQRNAQFDGRIMDVSQYPTANLVLTALLNNSDYNLTEHDRVLVTTPFAHRTAIARLYNTLTLGATLVIMEKFDAAETLATIVRERVSVTGLVPTVARMLLDAIDGDAAPYANLRMMISVGEAFPIELKKRLFATLPNIKLSSALAMTEAFGAAVLKSDDQITHAGAAGRPVPGVEVICADDDGKSVPNGEIGEILVRCGVPGTQLMMRAYWNRPEETAEAFRGGWLHTGDMGRFDAEGYLYVVDRKKDMILSGGLNIYSKEVEQAILSHPSVADVAVVGTADPQFGEAVVAFIELKRDERATQDEIIEHCRALIAGYKKPKYVFFDGFPKNAQGKALKKELRESAQDLATETIRS